jgi:hypothetical protein
MDGQVVAAMDRCRRLGDVKWPQGDLSMSSGHGASEDWGSRSQLMSRHHGDGTRLRGGGGLEEIVVDVEVKWSRQRWFYFSWGSREVLMRSRETSALIVCFLFFWRDFFFVRRHTVG